MNYDNHDYCRYDIIIIGGGPGGYVAASYATQFGKKVAVVEKNKIGGCCLNVGCIPTKVLLETANRYTQARDSETYGVEAGTVSFSWNKYKAFSEKVTSDLRKGVELLLKSRKVDVFSGEAKILAEHQIQVEDKILEAENIIIATGTRPNVPDKFSNLVITSDTFWNLESQPKSIVIVGGGVIGCEIASALSKLGTQVTIIEQMPDILPMFEGNAVKLLRAELEKHNVAIYTGTTVKDIHQNSENGNFEVSAFEVSAGEQSMIPCNYVLWSTGRTAVIPKGCENLKLTDRGFIDVDANCQTSVKNVYCIGDANGKALLAHAAMLQAMEVAEYICTGIEIRHDIAIPTTVFTSPAIAKIGLTEADCKQKNRTVAVGVAPLSFVGYSHVISDEIGYIKVIRDIETDTLLGAEIVGHNACELIHVFEPYVNKKLSVQMFSDVVFAHPTLSEGIKLAVEASYSGSPQF